MGGLNTTRDRVAEAGGDEALIRDFLRFNRFSSLSALQDTPFSNSTQSIEHNPYQVR